MAKTAVGTMPCQCCGKEVVVKANERGTLSYNCQWCDDSPYQKPGTLAFKAWEKKIKPMPAEEKPAAKPAAEAKPKPAAPAKPADTGLIL